MLASGHDDRRLRAAVYRFARAYIEIERGLRSPDYLEGYLTPAEYRRHRTRPLDPGARAGGPVLPTDIGHIHLDRHLPGQITATLPTREADQRWSALVLHFARNSDGQWRIDQLRRLTRLGHTLEPDQSIPQQQDLTTQIRRVTEERDLTTAALRATTSRLAELETPETTSPGSAAVDRLRHQRHTFARLRTELDAELTRLGDTHQIRQQLASVDRPPVVGDDATRLTGEQLVVALGPVPADSWRARLWGALAEEIHTYRQRWEITDPNTVLGPDSDHAQHHQDRDELAATLRASARALGSAPPGSQQQDRARTSQRDQEPGRAVER